MAQRKTRAAPKRVAELDDMNHQDGDESVTAGGELTIRAHSTGAPRVTFWPSSFDRLDECARDSAEQLMEVVAQRREMAKFIDELAVEMRDHGASWAQVGFCVGLTGEAARLRWAGAERDKLIERAR